MTSLPPHTLLQLSISLSSLLTLLCHIFLLPSSKPSACHTDPISSCMLFFLFSSRSACFPYSILCFLTILHLMNFPFQIQSSILQSTSLSPSQKMLLYTVVSALWVFNPNFSKHLSVLTNDPLTSSECISSVMGLHIHWDHKIWCDNAFSHWHMAVLVRVQSRAHYQWLMDIIVCSGWAILAVFEDIIHLENGPWTSVLRN